MAMTFGMEPPMPPIMFIPWPAEGKESEPQRHWQVQVSPFM
jgi:hypothetical protein